MRRPRLKDWQGRIAGGDTLTHVEVNELLSAWNDDLEDKDESIETATEELEEARTELKEPPEWGNCRRGCAPSYLDREGFCSPACHVGAPRGEFVTLAPARWVKPTLADGW